MQHDIKKTIERIRKMEAVFDELSDAAKKDPASINSDVRLCGMLDILKRYYSGGQWLKDYETDERGELPQTLKRGVLSQDGVYNLLYDIESTDENERGYIFNQNEIPKGKWRYGLRSSAAVGCGWIATYNALKMLGRNPNPDKLIRYYEHVFPVVNGNFGTFIPSVAYFFKKNGYKVKVIAKRSGFDDAMRNCDVGILFFYWHRKLKIGAHFVTVVYRDGRFIGLNTFKNSEGCDDYGESLEGFLEKQKYFMPVLLCISQK